MPHVILTAIGSDRPGLVDEVSEFIFKRGGNIEDSRMVNLRGQFAIMVLVGGPEAVLGRLQADARELSAQTGLRAELRPAGEAPIAAGEALPFKLTGTGIDQPGMVHKIAHLLRDMRINIESLHTVLKPAPYTGAPMFDMELIVSVPRATSLSQLRQGLAKVCDELNIDWQLDRVG
jgi:glycine cleavage system transcriptional repressor